MDARARGEKLTPRQHGYIGQHVRQARNAPAVPEQGDGSAPPAEGVGAPPPAPAGPAILPHDAEEIVEGVLTLASDLVERSVERRALGLGYDKAGANDLASACAMQDAPKRTLSKAIPAILAKRGVDARNLPEFAAAAALVAWGGGVAIVMRELSARTNELRGQAAKASHDMTGKILAMGMESQMKLAELEKKISAMPQGTPQ